MTLPFVLAVLLQALPQPSPTQAPVLIQEAEPVKVKVEVSDLFTSGGIVTVLGAVGLLITTAFGAYAAFRAKVTAESVQTVNQQQTKKLDNITLLVDGRYGEVLQELADVKRLLADQTGRVGDAVLADKAQMTADAQHKRTIAATAAVAQGEDVKPSP